MIASISVDDAIVTVLKLKPGAAGNRSDREPGRGEEESRQDARCRLVRFMLGLVDRPRFRRARTAAAHHANKRTYHSRKTALKILSGSNV